MDAYAALVFWRRVQSEPALYDAVFSSDDDALVARFGANTDELAVARHLRSHRAAAIEGVYGFQDRLFGRVRFLLRTYCPMTASLLGARGQDLDALIHAYNVATGFRDDGPCYYRCCVSLLHHIEEQADMVSAIPELTDTIRVERAKLQMLRSLAPLSVDAWRAPPTLVSVAPGVRYRRTPNSALVRVDHDITPLIVDAEGNTDALMAPRARNILIYLPSPDDLVAFCVLSDTAHAVFDALDRPMSVSEVIACLGQAPRVESRARTAMTRLASLGLIRAMDPGMGDEPGRA